MPTHLKRTEYTPKLERAKMVLGFTGWMDGGDVSTGTVEYLIEHLDAREIASINPESFYILNFPGSMEVSSLFRPHVRIEDGVIAGFETPASAFYCDEETGLILLSAREPNFGWRDYADCILTLAREHEVELICFVGSVAGIVPHTREPRIHCTVSDESLRPLFAQHELVPSEYEGPASFVTYLLTAAREAGVPMASLVAEVPAYVQGKNIKCIAALIDKLAAMLDVSIDMDEIRYMRKRFEERIGQVVDGRPDLAELLRKVEQDYDGEDSEARMDELRDWFEKQDFRLD